MTPPPAPPAEDYVLHADKRKMIDGLNKRMLFICVPMVVLLFAVSVFSRHIPIPLSHPHSPGHSYRWVGTPRSLRAYFSGLAWFILAEVAVLWWAQWRSHRKQVKPIVTLTRRGMTVDTTATHVGELPWDEVGEVRSYTLFVYRYVGVVPTDAVALCRRLGLRKAWLLWMNWACIPLYRVFGVFVAPINIPQVYLPITADELAAVIQSYRNAYGPPSAFNLGLCAPPKPLPEGTWPPPPTRPRAE